MHRDDADALNRTLDALANGEPVTVDDLDRDLLATVRWLDDLGHRDGPNPDFVARLEETLLSEPMPDPPAAAGADSVTPGRQRSSRGWSVPAIPDSWHLPRWASGGLVWVSWVVVVGLVVLALLGPLDLLDRSDPDAPAVAPDFPLVADLADHPVVGTWRLAPEPGIPALAVFHPDGSYVEVDPLQGTGIGIWRPTDERSVEVVVEWPNSNANGRLDPASVASAGGIGSGTGREIEFVEGLSTLAGALTVSEDGATLSGTWSLQQVDSRGEPGAAEPAGTLTAERMTLAPSEIAAGDLATHPIVGAWTLQPEQGPPSMVAFLADGTYFELSPKQGLGVGLWRATDARSGEVLVEWPNRNETCRCPEDVVPLAEGYLEGWATLESTFTVGADGASFAGTSTLQRYYPNGIEFHGQEQWDLTGTRLVIEAAAAPDVAPATHPVLGTWIADTDPAGEGPLSLEVFHADGTYISTGAWTGPSIGVWQATDERSGRGITFFVNQDTPNIKIEGSTEVTSSYTVTDGGASYTGDRHIRFFFLNGNQAVEEPSGGAQGTRFTFEAVALPAPSPVAATPEG